MLRPRRPQHRHSGDYQVKRIWLIVSVVCVTIALVFLIRHDFDKAFIVAAIGAVAWFLNYRSQMKELISQAEEEEELNGNAEPDEE